MIWILQLDDYCFGIQVLLFARLKYCSVKDITKRGQELIMRPSSKAKAMR